MTFFTNGIQALQHLQKECLGRKGSMLKNKPRLVIFHESILVSLWTFQLTLVNKETSLEEGTFLDSKEGVGGFVDIAL